ncbi:hypothetical protein EDC01DRAFT_632067 [Geopyxis carbonaria]|nr:hypothetical protein EDC01DRAFT_632067 [Geopyxis carbonaria]
MHGDTYANPGQWNTAPTRVVAIPPPRGLTSPRRALPRLALSRAPGAANYQPTNTNTAADNVASQPFGVEADGVETEGTRLDDAAQYGTAQSGTGMGGTGQDEAWRPWWMVGDAGWARYSATHYEDGSADRRAPTHRTFQQSASVFLFQRSPPLPLPFPLLSLLLHRSHPHVNLKQPPTAPSPAPALLSPPLTSSHLRPGNTQTQKSVAETVAYKKQLQKALISSKSRKDVIEGLRTRKEEVCSLFFQRVQEVAVR